MYGLVRHLVTRGRHLETARFEALLLLRLTMARRGVDSLVLDDICPLDHRFAAAEDGSGPSSDHGERAARQRKGESTSAEGDRV